MRELRRAGREALLLALAAAALGFVYTAATNKGFFAAPPPQAAAVEPRAPGPPPEAIQLDEAQRLFDGHAALFIDARHPYDYRLGHIKGAVNLPLKEFDTAAALLDTIPPGRLLVTYCDGAECNSSIELGVKLAARGFLNVKMFFGGWEEWQAQHLPVER